MGLWIIKQRGRKNTITMMEHQCAVEIGMNIVADSRNQGPDNLQQLENLIRSLVDLEISLYQSRNVLKNVQYANRLILYLNVIFEKQYRLVGTNQILMEQYWMVGQLDLEFLRRPNVDYVIQHVINAMGPIQIIVQILEILIYIIIIWLLDNVYVQQEQQNIFRLMKLYVYIVIQGVRNVICRLIQQVLYILMYLQKFDNQIEYFKIISFKFFIINEIIQQIDCNINVITHVKIVMVPQSQIAQPVHLSLIVIQLLINSVYATKLTLILESTRLYIRHHICSDCDLPGEDQCTSCPITRQPDIIGNHFKCLNKDSHYFSDDTQLNCLECHFTCKTCNGINDYTVFIVLLLEFKIVIIIIKLKMFNNAFLTLIVQRATFLIANQQMFKCIFPYGYYDVGQLQCSLRQILL
ncbi:unnamed protein product [Paramecium primaurelia]|uniref:Transmembrane protein n=1 Tax=Paramecium primaurelia TaxID=5886 RepID=A0A8S1P8L1_PARPR|nr:unnamed protein product [Paramecium primaurelia]